MDLHELCTIRSASEQAVIESLLMWHGIEYLVHNEHFGSLQVGPIIPMFNQKRVLVAGMNLGGALEILRDCLECERKPSSEPATIPTDRLRALIEVLLFFWFIPGRRRKTRQAD